MPPVFAWIEGLFAIGFLLISFIGWIINLINSQNPPPAPNRGPQRRPQARDRKVQNEIEQFLQEAMGNKQRGRAEEVRPDDIEMLEPAPPPQRRGPSRPKRRAPSRPTGPRPATTPQATVPRPSRPGSGVSSRHVVPSVELGRNVTSHLQEHMAQRLERETEQHLPHAVSQTVTEHLGEFTADDHDSRSTVRPVHLSRANIADPTGLIAQLRSPQGMRQAVVLQEILTKPRVLRK